MTPEQKRNMYIALGLLLVAAAGGGIYYYMNNKKTEKFSFEFF